jgi:hypothetical protein
MRTGPWPNDGYAVLLSAPSGATRSRHTVRCARSQSSCGDPLRKLRASQSLYASVAISRCFAGAILRGANRSQIFVVMRVTFAIKFPLLAEAGRLY